MHSDFSLNTTPLSSFRSAATRLLPVQKSLLVATRLHSNLAFASAGRLKLSRDSFAGELASRVQCDTQQLFMKCTWFSDLALSLACHAALPTSLSLLQHRFGRRHLYAPSQGGHFRLHGVLRLGHPQEARQATHLGTRYFPKADVYENRSPTRPNDLPTLHVFRVRDDRGEPEVLRTAYILGGGGGDYMWYCIGGQVESP